MPRGAGDVLVASFNLPTATTWTLLENMERQVGYVFGVVNINPFTADPVKAVHCAILV